MNKIETLLDKENEKMDKETKNMEHYWPCIHIREEDATSPNGHRRISYDITTFNTEQLSELNSLIMAINDHFPKIKIWMTGERWEVQEEQTANDEKIKKLIEENEELNRKMHHDALQQAISFPQ